ncbi:MAG TPA: hypothetical protein DCK95_07115 [Anaerolineaceae bacterium]|nr:hypothetical protein [Anaerolineaceae bacterium]
MKRWKLIIFIAVFLVILQACTITIGSPDNGASQSTVALAAVIDSPLQGGQYTMQAIDIRYKATAPEGVAAVELNIDGYVVNLYNAPDTNQSVIALQYSWTPSTAGSHIIRVRTKDAQGNWSNYTDAMIMVADNQPVQEQPAPQQPQATNTTAPTSTPSATQTPDKAYIYDVDHDVDKFFYNKTTCGANKITITMKVSDPDKVWSVVIFTRFLDKEGDGQTKWDSGHAMTPKGDGLYSITLESSKITNFDTYEFAVLRYQFVATDKDRNEVARSEVFEDVAYEICP